MAKQSLYKDLENAEEYLKMAKNSLISARKDDAMRISHINGAALATEAARKLIHGRSARFEDAIRYAMRELEIIRKNPKKVDNFKVVWTMDKIKTLLNTEDEDELC